MTDGSLDDLLGARPSSPLRRVLSVGLLIVAMAVAALLFIRFLGGSDVPYDTALAELDDFTPVLRARGEIHGTTEITMTAPQEGVIGTVSAPGSGAIDQGQELAAFDPAPIAQALLAASAALAEAQAGLDRAQIAESQLAARLERYERVWRRSNRRAPSLNEMEGAQADGRRAAVDVDAARARRDQAGLQLAASKARQSSADVLAPANGFVMARWVQPGQYVRLAQPLFTLAANTGGLKVVVPVGAAPAAALTPQAKAQVLIEGFPDRTRVATLTAITAAAGSAQRQAEFTLDQPEHEARPGMMATIAVKLPRRRHVLLVPDAALAFVPDGKSANLGRSIYVLSPEGTPRRVDVAVGGSDGSRTEVLASEIAPGTRVIVGWRDGPGRP